MIRPARQPETLTRRNMRLSTRDGGWYCVMWAVGESNLAVFGVALGLGAATVGYLNSVPRLIGSFVQLVSPRAVRLLGSHKRWIVITATVQALIFIPLAVAGILGGISTPLLFLLAAAYWAAAWACGNTWTTFISTLVPRPVRPTFFARRNRWLNVVIVASLLAGGWLLTTGRAAGLELPTFAALFFVAAAARLVSAYFLNQHTELVPIPPGQRDVPMRELLGRYRHGPGGRLLSYRLSVELAIQSSSPFVVPYLLRERGLESDYRLFAMLVAAEILAKAVTLPLCGRIAHRRGVRALLRIGGVLIVPVPLLWLVSHDVWWLLVVQIVSGISLAAYELSSFLLVFDTVPESERTSVMTRYNVAQFSASFIGSAIGATSLAAGLFVAAPAAEAAASPPDYAMMFVVAAVLRAATLSLLIRVPAEIQSAPVDAAVADELPPLAGSLEQPVIPLHEPITAAGQEPVQPAANDPRKTP